MIKTKIISVENSLGLILSPEVLSKLNARPGDEVFLIETPNGYQLVPYDLEFEKQMQITDKIRKKRKNLLKNLKDTNKN